LPAAAKVALARSRKDRAWPEPSVEHARDVRLIQQPGDDVDHVAHIDEVAQLAAVGVVRIVRA
jgi:hypothetical protein